MLLVLEQERKEALDFVPNPNEIPVPKEELAPVDEQLPEPETLSKFDAALFEAEALQLLAFARCGVNMLGIMKIPRTRIEPRTHTCQYRNGRG